MTEKLLNKIYKYALIVMLFVSGFGVAHALVTYSVSASLQPGDVTSTIIKTSTIETSNIDPTTTFNFNSLKVGTTTGFGPLTIGSFGTTTGTSMQIVNSASTTIMTVLDNGNVGLSSTTPNNTLDINGTIGVTGTTTFNNVAYKWPANAGASGQGLSTDGTKQLSWVSITPPHYNRVDTTGVVASALDATSTIMGFPANTLNASSTIEVEASMYCQTSTCNYMVVNSAGTPLCTYGGPSGASNNYRGQITFVIVGANSTSAQNCFYHGSLGAINGSLTEADSVSFAGEDTSAQNWLLAGGVAYKEHTNSGATSGDGSLIRINP